MLQKDEYWLTDQRIKGTQKVSERLLASCYQQQPNTTWLGMPWRRWIYNLGYQSFDKEAIQKRLARIEAEFERKIALAAGNPERVRYWKHQQNIEIQAQKRHIREDNFLMRWGEAPVLYDALKRRSTEEHLRTYLKSKGYFDVQVDSTAILHNGQARVTYHVQEHSPYLVRNLSLHITDQAITALLEAHRAKSFLKIGMSYDQEVLWQERERVYELLHNHGYYAFERQLIHFDVEKNTSDHTVNITMIIVAPPKSQACVVHHIDRVMWVVDEAQQSTGYTASYGGVEFKGLQPYLDPALLVSRLKLDGTRKYRKQDLIAVQKRLSELNLFKYVHVDCKPSGPSTVTVSIHTALLERYQLEGELGAQAGESLPDRPFCTISLKGRHLLGSLETLKLEAHGGAEPLSFAVNGKELGSALKFGVDLSVSWPQFLLPLMDNDLQLSLQNASPKTTFSIGGSSVKRSDFWQRMGKGTLSYTWKGGQHSTYTWVPFQLDLVEDKLGVQLKNRLQRCYSRRGNFYKDFNSYLLSVASLKGSWHQRSPTMNAYRSFSLLTTSLDSAGALQNLIDFQALIPWLAYYQYLKFDISYRQHVPISLHSVLAYCLHAGIAYPYGIRKVLPYNQYYFAGGGDSLRGWHSRSLGPGTYNATEERHTEQPGELLLRSSVEFRQLLVGILEGAFFVDAGNTWSLREDERPGSEFRLQDFYEAIAVNVGVGARLNFGMLVLRIDLGLKLYDPAQPLGDRFVGRKLVYNGADLLSKVVPHFGIGYPF